MSVLADIQEKTPWADSACADCPGFLVFGAADARPPSFVQEPQGVSLDLLHGPFEPILGSAALSNNGTHSTSFGNTRGHAPKIWNSLRM